MTNEQARRAELGAFLRGRRDAAERALFGLPPLPRNRRTGLRREEVAYLSGVSATWYTWLEQARPINPSRQVLDAVARTLRLTVAEHSYVLSLAGFIPDRPDASGPVAAAPGAVQRLMDALGESPAFATTSEWGIAGWNRAYAALYPRVAAVDPAERNLLWLVFTDPSVRSLLPDWEITSRRFLAEFRAEAGPRLGDPGHLRLVSRLLEASEAFRAGWETHDIEGFASRERIFLHPVAGTLHLEHHRLAPADHPDLHIVVYTPLPGTDAGDRLRRMLAEPAPPTTRSRRAPSS